MKLLAWLPLQKISMNLSKVRKATSSKDQSDLQCNGRNNQIQSIYNLIILTDCQAMQSINELWWRWWRFENFRWILDESDRKELPPEQNDTDKSIAADSKEILMAKTIQNP